MSQTITPVDTTKPHDPKSGKMRAGVYRGQQVVVETVPIPEIGEGELLFRMRGAA